MTNSQWMDEWMRAWRSFPGAASSNPWTAALDHFTRTQSGQYQQPLTEAVNKLTEQSRAFFELGEQIAANGREDWPRAVFEYLDGLADQAGESGAAARVLGGVSPLDYWRQFAGHDEQSPRNPPSFLSQLEKTLRTPGLGYTREHQEAVQELSRRWLNYEKAYGEYAAYCGETSRRSAERLRDRLKTRFEAGEGPATVRALYDAWVACSEEVYAERAGTEEYMKLHGRMVNALMAYKQQAAVLTDQWAEAANLPTRTEVDALHRKLKDTRQELNALKAGMARVSDKADKQGRGKAKKEKKSKNGHQKKS